MVGGWGVGGAGWMEWVGGLVGGGEGGDRDGSGGGWEEG